VSYFLRLPDGGSAGDGYAATGNNSLKKLQSGAIQNLKSVDGANTYSNWTNLTETIQAIVIAERNNNMAWVHTGSQDQIVNPGDNSDRILSSKAIKDAVGLFSWVGYVDYVNANSANLSANLSDYVFEDASAIFAASSLALTENKYVSKFTSANIALLPMDYYTVTRNPASCDKPETLTSSSVTYNSAVLKWNKIPGALGYQVDYKSNTGSAWISAGSAITDTFVTVSNLTAATSYSWRVRTNCYSNGTGSGFTQAQFTTADVCPDILENNNSYYSGKTINTGLNYNAQIAYNGDLDYYQFNNSYASRYIRVTVTNLPADYDVKLYDPFGILVGTSENWGTNSETVIYNAFSLFPVGTFRVFVYGYAGAYSNTQCYTLKVETSSTPFYQNVTYATASTLTMENAGGVTSVASSQLQTGKTKTPTVFNDAVTDIKIYPVPASAVATLAFEGGSNGDALVTIVNALGTEVSNQKITVQQGHNTVGLNLQNLAAGIYTVTIKYGNNIQKQKLVIAR
jgi:hypothetical protein